MSRYIGSIIIRYVYFVTDIVKNHYVNEFFPKLDVDTLNICF